MALEDLCLSAFPRDPWPHQIKAVVETMKAFHHFDTLALCAPTGGGKGLITTAIINLLAEYGKSAIVYNSRKFLTQQTYDRLEEDGVHFGVRAASMKEKQNLNAKFQIGSIQTDIARCINQGCWSIHDANLVIVDEAHLSATGKSLELLQKYLAAGSKILGITATPIGISHLYKELIVAGTNSDMRACGAHVKARVFAPHQLDLEKIKPEKTGEYNEGDIRRECWSQAIVGHIYNDWKRLNPDARPALTCAPGVPESVSVAQDFFSRGHKVAHIDAKEVWVNGERYNDDVNGTARNQVMHDMRKGEFDMLCHVGTVQEGVDIPSLYHLIMARPYGSLRNCLQVYGRVLRKSPETPDEVLVTDHGGNYAAHGSPNANRDFHSLFHMSEADIRKEREQKLKEDKEPEPITCPKCGLVRNEGARCPGCGHISDKRTRVIVQKDGTLREVEGRIYTDPPPKKEIAPEQKAWDNIFWPMRNAKSSRPATFRQAFEIYKRENGQYPPEWLKNIPRDEKDMGRTIRGISFRELQR